MLDNSAADNSAADNLVWFEHDYVSIAVFFCPSFHRIELQSGHFNFLILLRSKDVFRVFPVYLLLDTIQIFKRRTCFTVASF